VRDGGKEGGKGAADQWVLGYSWTGVTRSGMLSYNGELQITIMSCMFQKAGRKYSECFYDEQMTNSEKTDMAYLI
jgi:hypothetical protein